MNSVSSSPTLLLWNLQSSQYFSLVYFTSPAALLCISCFTLRYILISKVMKLIKKWIVPFSLDRENVHCMNRKTIWTFFPYFQYFVFNFRLLELPITQTYFNFPWRFELSGIDCNEQKEPDTKNNLTKQCLNAESKSPYKPCKVIATDCALSA